MKILRRNAPIGSSTFPCDVQGNMHMSMLQQHSRSICAPAANGQHTKPYQAIRVPCRAQQAHAGWQAAPLQTAAAVVHHQHHRQRAQQPVQQQLGRLHHHTWLCRSSLASQAAPEPIPDDIQLELNPDSAAKEVLYDEASKTVRIPLASVTDGQRRTKMVMFTCNKCGGRSARLVNPVAWERGAVFCQCQHCAVWHMLKADKSIIEEIRYNDPDWQMPEAKQGPAAAAAAAAAAVADAAAAAASGGVAELVPAEGSQASSGTGLSLGAGSDDGGSGDEATSQQQLQ